MVRNTIVATGHVGYRHQLDRTRRFLDRMENAQSSEIDFQDMVWAFFQNCWHIKDWVDNDPILARPLKTAVISLALHSVYLGVCEELCNGTKHLGKTRRKKRKSRGRKATAKHLHIEINEHADGRVEMDCIIDNGEGKPVSGRLLAHQCMGEWERIFQSQGLATGRSS